MTSTSQASAKRTAPDDPTSPSKRLKTVTAGNICEELYKYLHDDLDDEEAIKNLVTTDKIESLSSSFQGKNFIIDVAKKKRWGLVDYLIAQGVNFNLRHTETGETLSDIAYEQNQFNILAKILNADGPYPTKNDHGNRLPVKELVLVKKNDLLKAAVENRVNLHEYIRQDNKTMLKKFVADHPKLKHAYRPGNHSALSTALEHKRFHLYSWLCSEGFKSGVDLHFERLMVKLNETEKKEIRDFNRENFRRPERIYIYELVNKTRPAFGSEKENFTKIVRRLYETLDKNPKLQPVLKIVAEFEEADIVFDFNNKNVSLMDPSATLDTLGLTYPSGYIMIGASRPTNDLLGTIIHEFMHLAMQLVYENGCLPFFNGKITQRDKLKKLVEMYDDPRMKSKCDVISRALNAKYVLDKKIGELVVRPAHLMALYKDIPEGLKQDFEHLFEYYEKDILSDISICTPVLKKQNFTRRFNLQLGFFRKFNESQIYCESSKRVFKDIGMKTLFRTKTPELVATNFIKHLNDIIEKVDSKYVFTDLKTLLDQRFDAQFRKIFGSGDIPTLIVVSSDNNEFDSHSFESISNKFGTLCHMILIGDTDFSNSSLTAEIKDFNWIDLDNISKKKLLTTTFKLHNHEKSLSSINPSNSELVNEPLMNIMSLAKMSNYDEKLPPPFLKFSIKRKFKSLSRGRTRTKDKDLSTECLVDRLLKQEIIVIADVAGMGKSTSAIEIASLLKKKTSNWVAFIDLKDHVAKFKRDHERLPADYFNAKFFSEHILQLNSKPEIKFVFELMYEEQVTFIVDGFDEISPNYKNFVLALLSAIKKSGNGLLVTTRVHLRSDLEKHLGVTAISLMPLDENDGIDLITKYWASKTVDGTTEATLRSSAKKMLKRIQVSLKSKNKRSSLSEFFGIPMHVYILAHQTMNQISNIEKFNFNVYDMYLAFVTEKLKNCEDQGGPLAKDDRDKLLSFNRFEVYHKLALECFFDQVTIRALNLAEQKDLTPLCDERILSQGLLRSKDGKLEFSHLSYAEFFVADFIMKHIQKPVVAYQNVFFKILFSEKFGNVRKFLNEALLSKKQVPNNSLKKYLTEKVKVKNTQGLNNRKLLHSTVDENQIELLNFVLDCLNCVTKKKIEILTNKFKNDRTIHLSIKEIGTEAFELLFTWLGNNLATKDSSKILSSRGINNDIILDRARTKNNLELVIKIEQIR